MFRAVRVLFVLQFLLLFSALMSPTLAFPETSPTSAPANNGAIVPTPSIITLTYTPASVSAQTSSSPSLFFTKTCSSTTLSTTTYPPSASPPSVHSSQQQTSSSSFWTFDQATLIALVTSILGLCLKTIQVYLSWLQLRTLQALLTRPARTGYGVGRRN
jgi:hypothetical protein